MENLVLLNLEDSDVKRLWHGDKGFSEFSDSFLVGLPGTEIPEWFSYENLGSSIAFVLPPKCINAKYLHLAFCVVLEFKVPLAMEKYNNFVLACELHLKNADGNEVPLIMVAPKIYHDNVHFGPPLNQIMCSFGTIVTVLNHGSTQLF
ncbi:hypothetical protein GH714_015190 [Hevea brasiliensis]|uniref:C-JID domain-containing protein n=1 Tax=Hevea brasiliensis TaxID=3981 RepID=A0A6A6L985_HEVBR|nr:hypothetical protein GH714_015190 [Hevea brasiliensis]